jgi:serine protease Do
MSLRRTLVVTIMVVLLACHLLSWARASGSHVRRSVIVEVVDKARPAVVNIHSERLPTGGVNGDALGGPSPNKNNGMGTGIIIDPRGYIVTNHHVIEDVAAIRIRMHDGSTFPARVLTRDRDADLALLKVESPRPLPTLPIATSSDLMVGETVIAIGNAYGYEHTVSAGVVSALGRDVTLNKEVSYKSLIQTDASINPGNSGGPLLNVEGEVIGVNVAIRAGAQNIGFALPIDQVVEAVAEMLARRRQTELAPGLVCRNRIALRRTPPRYLEVAKVEPASDQGLQEGDVIIQVKDVAVTSTVDLERALLDTKPGERLPVRVRRASAEQHLELTVAKSSRTPSVADLAWRQLGLRLASTSIDPVTRNSTNVRGGMVVSEVNPESPAAKAGLQRGDILVGLHQWETLNLDNVSFVLNHQDLKTFYPLKFFVLRNGQMHKGWLQDGQ